MQYCKEAKSKPFDDAKFFALRFALRQRGTQNPRHICSPTPEEFNQLSDASNDILCWSATPRIYGALLFGREFIERDVLPAISHSDSDYEQIVSAYENGFTHVMHLYCCHKHSASKKCLSLCQRCIDHISDRLHNG